jgi:hypothetical protein
VSATLREVADALAEHGLLLCAPVVETDEDGNITLTVRVDVEEQGGVPLEVFGLYTDLQRVSDLATMRALLKRYGIEPLELEQRLKGEDR